MIAKRLVQLTDCYDLKRTIESGQAFHWIQSDNKAWETAWRNAWVGVEQVASNKIQIETNSTDTDALSHISNYFQCHVELSLVLQSFPEDALVQKAVSHCPGLRLLRQDPWLCLASFILSSTKQIPQIKEIVNLMSNQIGTPISCPSGNRKVESFPEPQDVVRVGEDAIRKCKAGFRAKYIYRCAIEIDSGRFDLESIRGLSLEEARNRLVTLPGVGPKIADCVLLFAYGFSKAFPIDVWIKRVLQDYYFNGKKVSNHDMSQFIDSYFGVNAGFVQQYLFDYIRSLSKTEWADTIAHSTFGK